jgi:outer membrane protein OmpA-like peptidoglycan-associated protein/opacity protein-like surface antigen
MFATTRQILTPHCRIVLATPFECVQKLQNSNPENDRFMKSRCLLLVLIASALPALAQPVSGPYVSLGVGADLLQDESLEPYGGFGPTRRDFSFDPGPAGTAGAGYGFGNGLRLEVEGDYSHNHLSGVRFPNGVPGEVVGNEVQFGGFVNLAYDFNLDLPVVPFLGVGAGYQALELDRVSAGRDGANLAPQISPTEGAFAYQGMAGLSYPVLGVPGLSLTAEYRLIGMVTPPPFQRSEYPVDVNGVERYPLATLSNIFNHEALIGLRYSFGAPPSPSLPPQQPPATSPLPAPPATRTYLVFFDWDRSDLSERARQIVAEAAAASTKVATTRIDVNGYTDLSGSAAYNQRLSVRRAESVEAELVRDGVPKEEIVIRGFGESDPLVPTATGVREPQNRRVEIILH